MNLDFRNIYVQEAINGNPLWRANFLNFSAGARSPSMPGGALRPHLRAWSFAPES